MAGAKETPRQKLISLMYLVFITMLALNVSKEVLDGFDVNVLLERKDADYMQFKAEIKDKTQIRRVLGEVSELIVEQFERWWDKYSISLSQIDAEVKESELVLHGFLKDLGYD